MNLSDNFSLAELTHSQTADRLGLPNVPGPTELAALRRTAQGLEAVRALVGKPIAVSSGYRAPLVNKAVGGKPTSQHTRGEAADITCPALNPALLMKAIVNSNRVQYDQCILEFYKPTGGGWVHISFTDAPRRQALVIDATGARPYA